MTTGRKAALATMAVLAVLLVGVSRVVSQDKGDTPRKSGFAQDNTANWMAMNAPGPEHGQFKKMVGTWDVETKMWMAPGAPPFVSKEGKAECSLLYGGRYLQQKFSCPMGPAVMEGMSIEGYDRFKKKYVSVWIDNMGGGIYLSQGSPDGSGKVFTYYGLADDPMTGEQDTLMRMVSKEVDEDTAVIEMYEKKFGMDEYKTMELTYRRAE